MMRTSSLFVAMKVVAKPTRHFEFAGVEFDYPRHLAFEVE